MGNYPRDLPVRRWRAGAGFILAHSYLKVLLCDYVNFSCSFHSSVTVMSICLCQNKGLLTALELSCFDPHFTMHKGFSLMVISSVAQY